MNLEDPFLFFPPSGLRLFLDFHGFFHKCPKKNWKLRPQKCGRSGQFQTSEAKAFQQRVARILGSGNIQKVG